MWLPPPDPGTSVCGGFDGSDSDDLTAIKLETREGFIFTPRWGADRAPAIWRPDEHGGRIPRTQVRDAWAEIRETYPLVRAYCDPGFHDEKSWESDIEDWDTEAGGGIFIPFSTSGPKMFHAVRRFEADLSWIIHDGCPTTSAHMRNARKIMGRNRTYVLGKPSHHQKIDCAVTTVLAHAAASDARADPDSAWNRPAVESKLIFFTR